MPGAVLLHHEHHISRDVSLHGQQHGSHDLLLAAHELSHLGKLQQPDLRNLHVLALEHLGQCRHGIARADVADFRQHIVILLRNMIQTNVFHILPPCVP